MRKIDVGADRDRRARGRLGARDQRDFSRRADSAFREELSLTAVDLKPGSPDAANWLIAAERNPFPPRSLASAWAAERLELLRVANCSAVSAPDATSWLGAGTSELRSTLTTGA